MTKFSKEQMIGAGVGVVGGYLLSKKLNVIKSSKMGNTALFVIGLGAIGYMIGRSMTPDTTVSTTEMQISETVS